jgi:hypothetical protein
LSDDESEKTIGLRILAVFAYHHAVSGLTLPIAADEIFQN